MKSKNLKAKASKTNNGESVPTIAVAGSLQAKLASHSISKTKKDASNGAASTVTSSVASSFTSMRHRSADGGHIQLDILSGEKLIPAKKGAVGNKESGAGPIPDRKPGLKITLNLPSSSTQPPQTSASSNSRASPMNSNAAASSSSLKKVSLVKLEVDIADFHSFVFLLFIGFSYSQRLRHTHIESSMGCNF
jgi:hypothetical protein